MPLCGRSGALRSALEEDHSRLGAMDGALFGFYVSRETRRSGSIRMRRLYCPPFYSRSWPVRRRFLILNSGKSRWNQRDVNETEGPPSTMSRGTLACFLVSVSRVPCPCVPVSLRRVVRLPGGVCVGAASLLLLPLRCRYTTAYIRVPLGVVRPCRAEWQTLLWSAPVKYRFGRVDRPGQIKSFDHAISAALLFR